MIVQTERRQEVHWSGLEETRSALKTFLGRRVRDENEVEDIIQETLLRAARYRTGLQSDDRLRPWVLRIATNVLRDHRRRTQRTSTVAVDEEWFDRCPDEHRAARDDPHGDVLELDGGLVDRETVLGYLAQAVARLSPSDRAVLASFYGGSGSCVETGQRCGLDPALVKVRLFRARRRIESWVRRSLFRDRWRKLES